MKIEPTPERQKQHNDDIHLRLKLVAFLGTILIISAIALEASLYFSPPSSSAEPTVVGSDGSPIGQAIPVAPDLVVTNIDPPSGSQLLVAGSKAILLQRVRSEAIRGVSLVLFRLQVSYPKEVPQIRAIDNGESASLASISGRWEGSLVGSATKDLFDPQPPITNSDISALIATSDNALVGIALPGDKGEVFISAQELLAKFPELKK